jgi:DNA ligase (NAD+)
MYASVEQLKEVDDIGLRTAKAVVDYFQNQDNVREVIELGKYGLPMQISGSSEQTKTLFSGKIFVVTGSFETFTRDQMTDMIKINGGKISSAISSNTDFLVVGTNPTESKVNRAFISNIKVISENELRKMVV